LGRNTAAAANAASFSHTHRSAGRVSFGAIGAVLLLLMLGLMASSASATTGHAPSDPFGVAFSNDAGGFAGGGPAGIAIRQPTGDIFVSDPGHTDINGAPAPRIQRFDAAGVYQSEFAIDPALYASPGALAIDPAGAATVYAGAIDNATQTGAVLPYSAAGVLGTALNASGSGTTFANPVAIAVDPADGTVFVSAIDSTTSAPVVDVFDNTGAYQSTFDGTAGGGSAFQGISSLAVDGSSRLYVADPTAGKVLRYSAAGAFQATVDGDSAGPVTADATSDEVYVLEAGRRVGLYSAGGAQRLDTFGAGLIGSDAGVGTGIAIRELTGTVYAADAGNSLVQRFTTFPGPTVSTDAATGVDATNATFHGTINPEGVAGTIYHFEYGTDPANYAAATADLGPVDGSVDIAATDTAPGLLPNTLYHVRLVGSNAGGTVRGNDQTFTTDPGPPLLDGLPPLATAITTTTATLNATIDPRGSDTTYHFEYGTTDTYGSVTADAGPLGGQGGQAVVEPLTALTPGTTYHFRVVADNGTGGAQNGADQTFTTAPAAAAGASSVTGVTAALTGTVNPHGSAATFHFEYGTTDTYGSATTEADAGSASADTTVSANVIRLLPSTTYHVRVVATDTATGATTTGADGTFTTNAAPLAATGEVSGVTPDRATFSGTYDTHGLGGSYQFVVGSSTSPFLGKTDPQPVSDAGAASGALDTLPPGETYNVRLAVTSSGVTTLGDAVTFSTPARPVAPPPALPATGGDASPYGCAAPVLAAYNQRPKPGDAITVTGADLGVGGSVLLGGQSLTPTSWTPTAFTIILPDGAQGTLPLTINCGKASNTIAIALYQAPSNVFTATGKVKGATATVSVKVPGPGAISIKSGHTKTATKHAGTATTYRVKVRLSAAGRKSLRRHKRLATSLTVRFTPTDGSTASKTVKVTFKR
jgi:hypothetical protein